MPIYSQFDRNTALCEHTRECDSAAINQFSGGPCQAHEAEYQAKKQARALKAKTRRKDIDDAMSMLGLTKVCGSVSGKVYYE